LDPGAEPGASTKICWKQILAGATQLRQT